MKQWVLAGVLALFVAAGAQAITVSGTITDFAGAAIPGIQVTVNHLGAVVEQRDLVYTDAAGHYSSSLVQSGDNVYLVVAWNFELKPAAAYNQHVVTLVARGAGDPFVPTTQYQLKVSPTISNIASDQTLSLTMDQVQPVGLPNIALQVNQTLDFVRNNAGSAPWSWQVDTPVNLITDDKDRMTPSGLFINEGAFDGLGTTYRIVTSYHEVGHWIHYHHNGNALPPSPPGSTCGTHTLNSEEDPGCALKEGYASYLAQLTAEANGVMDPFYRGYRDDGVNTFGIPASSIWRGDDVGGATGWDFPTWESGEVVEGAISGFLFGVSDATSFETVLKALMAATPVAVQGVLVELSNQAGAGSPNTLLFHQRSQQHGLVFSRAKLSGVPFTAPAPPQSGPPNPGNQKEINGFRFLRGLVPTNVQMVPAADLGVAQTFAGHLVRLGVKPATAGIASAPVFLPVGLSLPAAAGVIPFDTTGLGAGTGDGDWDLAVLHQNQYGFEDDFLPTWVGDTNAFATTDEAYLKTIGSWYEKDGDPFSDPTPEGMVIVDNTAPTVSNFKP